MKLYVTNANRIVYNALQAKIALCVFQDMIVSMVHVSSRFQIAFWWTMMGSAKCVKATLSLQQMENAWKHQAYSTRILSQLHASMVCSLKTIGVTIALKLFQIVLSATSGIASSAKINFFWENPIILASQPLSKDAKWVTLSSIVYNVLMDTLWSNARKIHMDILHMDTAKFVIRTARHVSCKAIFAWIVMKITLWILIGVVREPKSSILPFLLIQKCLIFQSKSHK